MNIQMIKQLNRDMGMAYLMLKTLSLAVGWLQARIARIHNKNLECYDKRNQTLSSSSSSSSSSSLSVSDDEDTRCLAARLGRCRRVVRLQRVAVDVTDNDGRDRVERGLVATHPGLGRAVTTFEASTKSVASGRSTSILL